MLLDRKATLYYIYTFIVRLPRVPASTNPILEGMYIPDFIEKNYVHFTFSVVYREVSLVES